MVVNVMRTMPNTTTSATPNVTCAASLRGQNDLNIMIIYPLNWSHSLWDFRTA
jgi:hypothetical protein